MSTISIVVNRLKIVDCADDDEDMDINLSVYVKRRGKETRVFSKTYDDVYVEEAGKVGNDERCVFFAGEHIEKLSGVDEVVISVDLESRDGDGFNWGGDHIHRRDVSALAIGERPFVEGKEHSSNPGSEGVYELRYTIIRHN